MSSSPPPELPTNLSAAESITDLIIPKSRINGHIFGVPTEVLCAIFTYSTESTFSFPFLNPGRKNLPGELTVSHVCKFWRTIALGLPQLWSDIQYFPKKSTHSNRCKRIYAYLKRSGAHTLDISLDFKNYGGHWFNDQRSLLQALVREASRWRRFTILIEHDSARYINFHTYLKDIHAPNLESFVFCPGTWGLQQHEIVASTLFDPRILRGGAPVLKSIRIGSDLHFSYLPPLNQGLTTLRIDNQPYRIGFSTITLEVLIQLLQIHSLTDLSISGVDIPEVLGREIAQVEAVAMNNVKNFRCSSPNITRLFQYINTPHLGTLVLKDVKFPLLSPQSTSELTALFLIDCDIPWGTHGKEILHITKQVTHLAVSEKADGVFYHISTAPQYFHFEENRWPCLEYLAFNIKPEKQPDFYYQFALLRHPFPLTLCVHQRLLDLWEIQLAESFCSLRNLCKLETWNDFSPMFPRHWPYETGMIHNFSMSDYDPFRVVSYH